MSPKIKIDFEKTAETTTTTIKGSPWASFYEDADVSFTGVNDGQDWVTIKDPFKEGESAGFSLTTGLLHLWSTGSQEDFIDYLKPLGIEKHLRAGSEDYYFTPAEFLMRRYDYSREDAIKAVNEFTEKHSQSDFEHFGNKDVNFVKDTPKLQPKDVESLKVAQDFLLTDDGKNSDIVQNYCFEKGISYETLVEFGAGVQLNVNGYSGNDQILIPYYMNHKLVGVRVRGWSYKRAFSGTMMTLFGLQQLSEEYHNTVVVVEGETDALVTKQVIKERGFDEVPVVAIPTNLFKAEWKRLLKHFTRIIAIPQTDHASTKFASSIAAVFGEKVEVIEIPFKQFDIGKDISHFLTRSSNAAERLFLTLGLSKQLQAQLPRIETLQSLYATELDDKPFWIDEILPKGSFVILAGPPKSGKTFIGLEMALSVMKGQPLFDSPKFTSDGGGRVLYIVEENSRNALIGRFKTMGFTEDLADQFYLMHLQNVRLDERESVDELRRDVTQLKPDLVVFDPFANFHSQEENSASGVQKVLQSITRMMKTLPDTTFIIIHHTGKNGETPRIRGSSALWGRADLQLLVLPVQEDRATEVQLKVSGREINPDVLDTMDLILESETLTHILSEEKFDDRTKITLKKDRTKEKAAILEAMELNPTKEWQVGEIAKETGMSWYDCITTLEQMAVEKDTHIWMNRQGRGKPVLVNLKTAQA